MITSQYTINYLLLEEIQCFIKIIKYYNMNYSKRKIEEAIPEDIIFQIKKSCV